jgi:hypothetical protein
LSSRSTGKRTAARTLLASNKKRSGITKARNEYVGVEEGLDSDETIDETVVDVLKVIQSTGAGNEDKTVGGDNDNDDHQDEEDGEGEETVEGLIHELQALEEESEPGFYPLIRALYHAVSLSPLYICSGVEIVSHTKRLTLPCPSTLIIRHEGSGLRSQSTNLS